MHLLSLNECGALGVAGLRAHFDQSVSFDSVDKALGHLQVLTPGQ